MKGNELRGLRFRGCYIDIIKIWKKDILGGDRRVGD